MVVVDYALLGVQFSYKSLARISISIRISGEEIGVILICTSMK